MAAQFTLINGLWLRSESAKIMRATISLPTPLSPRIRTVALVFATLLMVSRIRSMRGEELNSRGKSWSVSWYRLAAPRSTTLSAEGASAIRAITRSSFGPITSLINGRLRNSVAPIFAASKATCGDAGAKTITGSVRKQRCSSSRHSALVSSSNSTTSGRTAETRARTLSIESDDISSTASPRARKYARRALLASAREDAISARSCLCSGMLMAL